MAVTAVLGAQWGDEGKGKLVDLLAQSAAVCARFNGGSNAGHTLVIDGKKYAFHLLPCGIMSPDCVNVIGNGVVLHLPTFFREISQLSADGESAALSRVVISDRASLLFDLHQQLDGLMEGARGVGAIGTTRRGIGPCYATKALRTGLRVGDLLHFDEFERKFRALVASVQQQYPEVSVDLDSELALYAKYAEILRLNIRDTTIFMAEKIASGENILVEGANAAQECIP